MEWEAFQHPSKWYQTRQEICLTEQKHTSNKHIGILTIFNTIYAKKQTKQEKHLTNIQQARINFW